MQSKMTKKFWIRIRIIITPEFTRFFVPTSVLSIPKIARKFIHIFY